MFTNLVGFIKPLLKKDSTTTKTIAKTRAVGEDEQKQFKNFEDQPDVVYGEKEGQNQTDAQIADDKVELSLAALRHLVEQADAREEEKAAALAKVAELQSRGIETLAVPPGSSVVTFLNNTD